MIPFVDLKSQYGVIKQSVQSGIDGVLEHGQYVMGPEVFELEAVLAEYVAGKYCITCSSGTDALLMALLAKGVGSGDLIFTTPFTFIATAEVIALSGAIPVFVDVDPATMNIDPCQLKLAIQAVAKRDPSIYPLPKPLLEQDDDFTPRGIIPVDLFGLPADYDAINALAKENGLFVVADAAQGFGGEYKGGRAGSLAEISCTSFFPAKPLGCYGDGGAVFVDDSELKEKLESIRVHGQGHDRYENVRLGMTARMDSIQAAVLLEKLKIFPGEIERRQAIADRYSAALSDNSDLTTPEVPDGYKSAWAQYSVLAGNGHIRDVLRSHLSESGIPTAIYYPKPLHLQSAFDFLGYSAGDFKVSEDLSSRILSLPMHPYLSNDDVQKIVSTINSIHFDNGENYG